MSNRTRLLYSFLLKFPLSKPFFLNVLEIFEWKYPDSEEIVERASIQYVLKLCIMESIFLVLSLCMWNHGLMTFFLELLGMYMVAKYYEHSFIRTSYTKLLEQFEQYLDKVRNNYQSTGEIQEALEDTMFEAPPLIASHIKQLLKVFDEEDAKKMQQYKEKVGFPYLLTFYTLCRISSIYGDSMVNHSSSFLKNINCLKEEVHAEILHRSKVKHVFSGLIFVITFPMLFLDIIKNWSIYNLKELSLYYNGCFGLACVVIICMSTVIIFRLILYLLEPVTIVKRRHILVEWLCTKTTIRNLAISRMLKREAHYKKMKQYLFRLHSSLNVTELIVMKWWCAMVVLIVGPFFIGILSLYKGGNSAFLIVGLLMINLVLSFVLFKLPDFIVAVKILCLGKEIDEELMRLQLVLMLLSSIDRIMLESILEWLSFTSIIYQEEFLICQISYLEESELALKGLKKQVNQVSFEYLIDNLMACDRVGVKKAFEGLPSEYRYYLEKSKQQNAIRLDNQSAIGRTVAYLPMILVIGGYLIIPFVLESITQFSQFIKQMQII